MNKKKMSKRQRDIKSKLMAAIAMLLVSSIMMVSTTYAWFTLSTAPEVTGIQTAVGANGNLEMALLPYSGNTGDIKSNVGDSMAVKSAAESNITWGNWVDLQDSTVYGLSKITLNPSALNKDEAGNIVLAFPVAIPEYGVDGRVSVLNKTAAETGVYQTNGFYTTMAVTGSEKPITPYGVRAIGTVSGSSPAQLEYKGALAAASSAANQAKSVTTGTLKTNGSSLANIAVNYAQNGDSAVFTQSDVTILKNMVDDLLGTDTKKGALSIIEDALKEYMVAYYLVDNTTGYEAKIAEIRSAESLDKEASYVTTPGMATMVEKLNGAIANMETAKSKLAELTSDSITWAQIKDPMAYVADVNNMKINDFMIANLMEKTNLNALINSILGGNPVYVYMLPGSGVFADIADFCGDYAQTIAIEKIAYNGLTATNVKATMATQTALNPTYLADALQKVQAKGTPEKGDSDLSPMSDYYGYILDLAFRTNVADSFLQLRTEAVDRIYSDNTSNDSTMGGGSTMNFRSTDTGFDETEMLNLMKHLKIILFDTKTGTIIGYVGMSADEGSYVIGADKSVTVPLVMVDDKGAPKADANIMALDKDVAEQLSVMMYLDGTDLTNADVANEVSSMSGTLNLQFGSSATLTPMEYADLRNGTVVADQDQNLTANATVSADGATSTSDTEEISITGAGYYASMKAIGVQLKNVDPAKHDVTIGVGSGAAEAATYYDEIGAWVVKKGENVTITKDTILAVTVTDKAETDPDDTAQTTTYTVTYECSGAHTDYSIATGTATNGTAYVVTLTGANTETYDYTVTYKVGADGETKSLPSDNTIPVAEVVDNITVYVVSATKTP